MAGRSSKQNQDNFEKMKREMAIKKQKAEIQQNPGPLNPDLEKDDLRKRSSSDCPMQDQDIGIEAVIENSDEGKSDFITGKKLEEDIVEKNQQDEKENLAYVKKIEIIVFKVDEEEFALRISTIKEIIRVPALTNIPNVPHYIAGLCSLRGELLPVIDSRKLFGMPDKEWVESSRIIVTDILGKQVGLVSDKVSEVISVEEAAIKEPPGSIQGIDGGVIKGLLILNNGRRVVMLLDAEKLIEVTDLDAFANQQHKSAGILKSSEMKEDEVEQIVILNIGKGEYAFNISYVKEIIRLPDIMKVPDTASYIEGVFSIRNQLLAVINPGKLLGMDCKQLDEYSRVVIINNGSFSYGVTVDKVSQVISVQKELFNESNQIANSPYIQGIFNMKHDQSLIMLLDPHRLISFEETKGLMETDHQKMANDKSLDMGEVDNNLEHIVVFKLGEEEYGIEINYVQEINRVSEIIHFPGAPNFIVGMVNLREDIIPMLNLRKLFGVHDLDSYNASKFLVVEFGSKRIGILIDAASEVLKFSKVYLEEAPELIRGNVYDNYIDKIAKLNDGKRIILLLNLSTLLSFM